MPFCPKCKVTVQPGRKCPCCSQIPPQEEEIEEIKIEKKTRRTKHE